VLRTRGLGDWPAGVSQPGARSGCWCSCYLACLAFSPADRRMAEAAWFVGSPCQDRFSQRNGAGRV